MFNHIGELMELSIHERLSARLNRIIGIEKYKTLRKELVVEEELNEISIDNFMMLSVAVIYKDKVLLNLFAEKCEIYGCCPNLFDKERNLHLNTMPSEVMEYLRRVYAKLNHCIANGYFNSIGRAS
jgi:hypothetical protein